MLLYIFFNTTLNLIVRITHKYPECPDAQARILVEHTFVRLCVCVLEQYAYIMSYIFKIRNGRITYQNAYSVFYGC